jgi:hypothetical protein
MASSTMNETTRGTAISLVMRKDVSGFESF